jgi:uncharacterized membrane protein
MVALAAQESPQEIQEEVREQMMKVNKPARGYAIMAILIGLLFFLGMDSMHWSFKETAVIGAIGTVVGTILISAPFRRVNRK